MCVPLRACCCCLPLEIGCVIIAVFMIITRLLLLLGIYDFGGEDSASDEEWDLFSDSSIYLTFVLIGIIIPLILLLAVCCGSSLCLLVFIVLEVIWLILFVIWYLYTNSGGLDSSEDAISYVAGLYTDKASSKLYSNSTYLDEDDDYDEDDDDDDDDDYGGDEDEGKTKKALRDIKHFFKRHYWILPLLMICLSLYFLYVAYSLYRYWREEDYYYYDEEPYYYYHDHGGYY